MQDTSENRASACSVSLARRATTGTALLHSALFAQIAGPVVLICMGDVRED